MLLEALCSLSLVASLFTVCGPATVEIAGYVEGEYVRVAPLEATRIERVAVSRGAIVKTGDLLAVMETDDAKLSLQQAAANLAEAESNLANLELGRRPEEIAVLEAQLRSAKARAEEAQLTLIRQQELFQRAVIAKSTLDNARMTKDMADAAVEQAEASLAIGSLAARPDEIKAARNKVAEATAARNLAAWKLKERELLSPAAGEVTDVVRRAGETAGPSAPVLDLLPDNAVKLIAFAPEAQIAAFQVGSPLAVTCDGCPSGLTATITFRANAPEFTPPVIYSVGSRQKLVYRIEARPALAASASLKPGQIVDVSLSLEP